MSWIAQLEASDETAYARAYPTDKPVGPAVSVDLQYILSLVSQNTSHEIPVMTINEGRATFGEGTIGNFCNCETVWFVVALLGFFVFPETVE